jgi:D-alanine-D-alanine ligase
MDKKEEVLEKAQEFKRKKIGVLMGGLSEEREISIKSGTAVTKALVERRYKAVALDCGRDIAWTLKGEGIDVAFIALHGRWGENGSIQGLLEVMSIPYTGSGVLPSALAMDKVATKMVLAYHAIPTPPFKMVRPGVSGLNMPVIVKPANQGSTIGVTLVKSAVDLEGAVEQACEYGERIIAEKFIEGRELTVSILDGGVLPIIEIISEGIYDYKAKYMKGMADFKVPAALERGVEKRVKDMALDAYTALGCSGAARVDLILARDDRPYVLELNTVPGMTERSLFPMAAASVGMGYSALVEKMLLGASLGR